MNDPEWKQVLDRYAVARWRLIARWWARHLMRKFSKGYPSQWVVQDSLQAVAININGARAGLKERPTTKLEAEATQ